MNITNTIIYCTVLMNATECRKIVEDKYVPESIKYVMREHKCQDMPNMLFHGWWDNMKMEKQVTECPNNMYRLDLNTLTTYDYKYKLRGNTPSERIICCKYPVYNDDSIIGESISKLNMNIRRRVQNIM